MKKSSAFFLIALLLVSPAAAFSDEGKPGAGGLVWRKGNQPPAPKPRPEAAPAPAIAAPKPKPLIKDRPLKPYGSYGTPVKKPARKPAAKRAAPPAAAVPEKKVADNLPPAPLVKKKPLPEYKPVSVPPPASDEEAIRPPLFDDPDETGKTAELAAEAEKDLREAAAADEDFSDIAAEVKRSVPTAAPRRAGKRKPAIKAVPDSVSEALKPDNPNTITAPVSPLGGGGTDWQEPGVPAAVATQDSADGEASETISF